ncbi:hypothetical protein PC113_g17893 [Phytophthora cactorum]|uniref:Uncharacterized protein n=1 Tax=Phytophthora cactorum TaxID=29920 RepID=A0A8T0YJP1_9STRA|nr:hypothetical protein PC113_g17893 [Phytophthora cactorum]KAG3023725.1 hypothetical protein PC120_g7428 [Phytophthora cactorum]KAG3184365.1 hypothetical protein C6341_g5060 [Phytophthora cactorum]
MVTLNTPDQKRLRFMLDEANVLSNIRLEFDAALYHLVRAGVLISPLPAAGFLARGDRDKIAALRFRMA